MNHVVHFIIVGFVFLLLILVFFQFIVEKEGYAVKQTLKILLLYIAITTCFLLVKIDFFWLSIPLVLIGITFFILLFAKSQFPIVKLKAIKERIDERITIFSRMFELKTNPEKKKQFYAEFPNYEQIDEKLRKLPGLFSKDALYYNPKYFEIALKNEEQVKSLFPLIEGTPRSLRSDLSSIQIGKEIVLRANIMGAVSVGFTKLKKTHFYSKKGRGELYGEAINSKHKYAIAITVEMDKYAISKAPKAPVVAESMKQYYHSAKIATSIADYLRKLGYEATAHIDANYEIICPLVARDAGLGDIGRMGLLMTPKLGPRVRISVVTTTLELHSLKKKNNNSLQYFCSICEKCTKACPAKAIQHGNQIKKGKLRYKIDHERCYSYWAKVGTDCARCISVCPYAHPNNWFHNIIRFGIKQNMLFARLALMADNFFYGKIPKIKD